MDNQHQLIKGYRDLSQAEIDLTNEIKTKAVEVGALVEKIYHQLNAQYESLPTDMSNSVEGSKAEAAEPYLWLGTAKLDLQTGFMKLVRAVAQPTTF